MRLSSTIFSSSLIYNCSLLCLCSRKRRRRLKTDYLVEYLLSDGAIISWGQSYFLSMQFAVDWIKECLPVNHPRTVLVTVPLLLREGGKKDTPFLLIAFHQICALGVGGLSHVHRESVMHPKRARKGTSKHIVVFHLKSRKWLHVGPLQRVSLSLLPPMNTHSLLHHTIFLRIRYGGT